MPAEIVLACVLAVSPGGEAQMSCASKLDRFEVVSATAKDGKAEYRLQFTREALEKFVDKTRQRLRDDFRLKRDDGS